jgi:hypothetical protein
MYRDAPASLLLDTTARNEVLPSGATKGGCEMALTWPVEQSGSTGDNFSSGDGWAFEGGQGTLGHVIYTWKRPSGHELLIDVVDAVEGPYFVAQQAQFT